MQRPTCMPCRPTGATAPGPCAWPPPPGSWPAACASPGGTTCATRSPRPRGPPRALSLPLADRAVTLIDDTYNANPDSVVAAINVLAELPGPRLLVLGDMGEVGEQGLAFHLEVLRHAHAPPIH